MVFTALSRGEGKCSEDGIGQWQIPPPPMWTNSRDGDAGREPGATKTRVDSFLDSFNVPAVQIFRNDSKPGTSRRTRVGDESNMWPK